MKIASWNVNGIISRRKALIKFLNKVKPDILCAQEIKTQCALNLPGYELYWNVSERKGYAGTLILTRRKPAAYQNGIGIEKFDAEARSITMEFKDYILVNVYVPSFNTASPPERRNFRLEWDAAFREYISRLQKPAILCGDYNVVRSPMDTYPDNSSSAADRPFSPEAEFIEGFEKLLELGYADVFRTLNPSTEGIYSWWGPKNKNRLYNRGSRLDYILVSNRLLGFTAGIKYHMNIQDSDHCPVTINISPPALYSEQIQEDLADKWRATDWQQMESILFDMQKELAQAADRRDWESVSQIQRRIEASWPARALAVRAVADKNTAAGVDGVKWETDAERAEAAKRLTVRNYHPLPYRHKEIVEGNGRTRTIHIPAARDQAMQILQRYTLEPVAEATADKRSFSARKCRTPLDAHAYLQRDLESELAPELIVKIDVEAYYSNIAHKYLLDNIPMNKQILRKQLKAGVIKDGLLFDTEQGISLGGSLSPVLANMMLNGLQTYIYDRLYPNGHVNYL